jgi:hypothetical protein
VSQTPSVFNKQLTDDLRSSVQGRQSQAIQALFYPQPGAPTHSGDGINRNLPGKFGSHFCSRRLS